MLPSSIILGPVVTEKAERLKTRKVYVIRVHPQATKIDVKHALRSLYDVQVDAVRTLRTRPKIRVLAAGKLMEKRHRSKRMIVTLTAKSKELDLTNIQSS